MNTDQATQAMLKPSAALEANNPPPPAARPPSNVALMHIRGVASSVYSTALRPLFAEDHPAIGSSAMYVKDLWERFQPRDAAEELLVSQMIQAQARITNLTASAGEQKNLAWAKMMYDAAERASNTFRRQMLALSEYRNPKKPGPVTTIEQANIAQQQVVQNHPGAEKKKTTNELGCGAQDDASKAVTSGEHCNSSKSDG